MDIEGMDSSLFERPQMARALATRDITTVYRLLVDHGVTQRHIAGPDYACAVTCTSW
jgi:hypothetical protein